MRACSFDRLLQFVSNQLDREGQLEVHAHVERCDICRDAVCSLVRDRHEESSLSRARGARPPVFQRPSDAVVGSRGARR